MQACPDWVTKPGVQQGVQWAVDLATTVGQHMVAGTIRAYPDPGRQLVNLPDQVYIDGAGVNGDRQTVLRQQTQLGGFTFVFETKLVDVDWQWGDNAGDQIAGPGGLGQNVHPPDGTSSVQHSYASIGTYRVSAAETWAVAAFMIDPAGVTATIPQATNTFRPSTQATFHLSQLEGVPVSH